MDSLHNRLGVVLETAMIALMNDSSLDSRQPFFTYGTASADALSASDPSMTRETQRGRRHGVSGDRAVAAGPSSALRR